MSKAPKTLQDAVVFFSDYANCHEYMVNLRWPDGKVRCPRCGSENVSWLPNAKVFKCYEKHERQKFSLKVGTIFEDSPIPLEKWLPVMWMLVNCKNGVSSYEIHRAIGVTQKTAWFMLHRIRLAMSAGSFETKMSGQVEVDEAYVGGKIKNMHKRQAQRARERGGWAGKVAVLGLLERNTTGSKVRTKILKGTKRSELFGHIKENVEEQSNIYTDALPSYASMNHKYRHEFIDHSEAYVRGAVHTNGLENFWSLLKRAIKGTYVAVDPVHLFRYVDEEAFRFNNRKDNDAGRFADMLESVSGKRITYKELIGTQPA